jgi:hypothetical protein
VSAPPPPAPPPQKQLSGFTLPRDSKARPS